MNKVFLKGNFVRDPEVKNIATNGKEVAVTNFTVAVSRFFKKNNGESGKDTEFIQCEAWDSSAEFIGNNFKKGDPILIEGLIKTNVYEDKEQNKKYSTKVRLTSFEKLYRSPKRDYTDDSNTQDTHTQDTNSQTKTIPDDNPF